MGPHKVISVTIKWLVSGYGMAQSRRTMTNSEHTRAHKALITGEGEHILHAKYA